MTGQLPYLDAIPRGNEIRAALAIEYFPEPKRIDGRSRWRDAIGDCHQLLT